MAEEKLNSQNLIEILINKYGFDKEEAGTFLKEFFGIVEEGLEKDGIVKVKGLGTFKLIEVKSRESINVNTGERFEIKGHTKVSFTPETSLRDDINKPFAHFETIVLKDGVTFEDEQSDEYDPDFNDDMDVDDQDVMAENPDKESEFTEQTVSQEESQNSNIIIPASVPLTPVIAPEQIVPESVQVAEIPEKENEVEDEIDLNKEEERIPEEPVEEEEKKDSSATAVLIAILLTLIICGAAIIFIFFPGLFSKSNGSNYVSVPGSAGKEIIHPIITSDSINSTNIAKQDSIVEANKNQDTAKPAENSVAASTAVTPKPKVQPKPATNNQSRSTGTSTKPKTTTSSIPFSKIPVNPDYTSYKIVGTKTNHTIKAGETLTRISYDYYGTKDLYPYILQHNSNVINPNNIPAGVRIRIPELQKK